MNGAAERAALRAHAKELRDLLWEVDMTQVAMAEELDVSQPQMSLYLTGRKAMPEDVEQRFREVVESKKRGAA